MRLFLLLLLIGCGSEQVQVDSHTPPDFSTSTSISVLEPWSMALAEYEHQFRVDAEEYGIDLANQSLIVLQYADLDGETIGRCYPDDRAVYIDPEVVDPVILKVTIYHELGHCYLNQGHSDGIMNAGIQVGNPSMYLDSWNDLLAQLFYEGVPWE